MWPSAFIHILARGRHSRTVASLAPHETLIDQIRAGSQAFLTEGLKGPEDTAVCLCGVGPPGEGPASVPVPAGGHAQGPAEERGGGGAGLEGESQRQGRGAPTGTARASEPPGPATRASPGHHIPSSLGIQTELTQSRQTAGSEFPRGNSRGKADRIIWVTGVTFAGFW